MVICFGMGFGQLFLVLIVANNGYNSISIYLWTFVILVCILCEVVTDLSMVTCILLRVCFRSFKDRRKGWTNYKCRYWRDNSRRFYWWMAGFGSKGMFLLIFFFLFPMYNKTNWEIMTIGWCYDARWSYSACFCTYFDYGIILKLIMWLFILYVRWIRTLRLEDLQQLELVVMTL